LSDSQTQSVRIPERFAACFEKLHGDGVIVTRDIVAKARHHARAIRERACDQHPTALARMLRKRVHPHRKMLALTNGQREVSALWET
jgi:hypothetical protein